MAVLSNVQGSLQQRLQVLRILWLAQFASVFLFLVVGVVLSDSVESVESTAVEIIRPLLFLAALALGGLSWWWRQSFATSPSSPLYLFEGISGEADEESVATALTRLQTNCVIVWALSEAVGIFGLVLALLTRDAEELAPFIAAAFILLYLHRPSAWPIDRIVRGLAPGSTQGS